MPTYVFGNFFATELTVGVTVGTTTLQVPPSSTLLLEAFDVLDLKEARLTLWDGQLPPEIVGCTVNEQDGNLTVARGLEGTTAQAWPAGTQVVSSLTAEVMNAALAAYFDFNVVLAASFLKLTGGVLTGALILADDPVDPLGAATKNYVDSIQGSGLPLSGGTMQGTIDMNSNVIINLPTPTVASNPATKAYVDAAGSFPVAALNDFEGSLVAGGTSTAYTVVSNVLSGTYANGERLSIRFGVTNGVAATLNKDALGSRPIQIAPAVAAPSGTLIPGVPTSLTYDSVNSAWTIGEARSVRTAELLIKEGTELTAPAILDALPIWDDSAVAPRWISATNFLKVISLLTPDTDPQPADGLLLHDAVAGAAEFITLENALKVINALTADAAPDRAADYVVTYDASAAGPKKVLLNNLASGWQLIGAIQNAAASTEIEFTANAYPTAFDETYDQIMIDITALKVSVSAAELWIRVGTGAGPTWQAGASAYFFGMQGIGSGGGYSSGSIAFAQILATAAVGIGENTHERLDGHILFKRPNLVTVMPIEIHTNYLDVNGHPKATWGNAFYATAAAITGIRFLPSSGNFASGTFKIYGLKN